MRRESKKVVKLGGGSGRVGKTRDEMVAMAAYRNFAENLIVTRLDLPLWARWTLYASMEDIKSTVALA